MAFRQRTTVSTLLDFLLFASIWIAVSSTGSEINGTQEVANLMDQLFDDNHDCSTSAMELGFLVAGSYNEPPNESEKTFRKALEFVRKTARQIKISDSGTHVGLVVYGKKPYMAFDFNECFDMPSLSQAIEEIKTPITGSRVGEALSFAKKQLYDRSARPGIPKALIVLLSKKSEDIIDHGVEALKETGVKIYTVGIEAEGDPLEMSDMASDVGDIFVADHNQLKSLATKLVPKLCEDSKAVSNVDGPIAPVELNVTSDDPASKMNPEEEPGPAANTVSINGVEPPSTSEVMVNEGPVTAVELNGTSDDPDSKMNPEEEPGPAANTVSINEVEPPTKPEVMVNEAVQSTEHLQRVDQGAQMGQNASRNDNTFQDALNDTSSHVNLFHVLSGTKDVANVTAAVGNYSDTTDTMNEKETTTDKDDDSVAKESTSTEKDTSDNIDTATPRNSTPPAPRKRLQIKDIANKICSAKADIGILIDGSSTVRQEKFTKLLNFTESLVRAFSISKDRTHIAVATASKGPHMSFDFQGFNDVPSLATAISRITYEGGPFLLGSSLTGLKTSWFKNSGRKSIPQLLLVLATTSSIDDIVAPSRVLRDRGVRIESVGIGSGFNGAQLKEIATHPAQDHVMAVSKFELLPLIRPLLTIRMCRAVGGKLIPRPASEIHDNGHPIMPSSPTWSKQGNDDMNKEQHLPTIKQVNQVMEKNQTDQVKQVHHSNLEARLKQLDQYKQIQKQDNPGGNTPRDKGEIEKERIRKDIRRKLYALLRRLGGTKIDISAAYRSIIYNINGHHDSINCKDTHGLCKQWAKDNLCEKGNETMDSQSVQRVCPKSCNVCLR